MFRRPPQGPDNRKLLSALEAAAADPVGGREPLFRALLQSSLLVLLQEPAGRGDAAANLKLMMYEEEDQVVLPVFTDQDALGRFYQDRVDSTAVPVPALCKLAAQGSFDRLFVNPAGPLGYEPTTEEMAAMAAGRIPDCDRSVSLGEGSRVRIGMPVKRPSDEALQELKAAVKQPGVKEAWWFWMSVNDEPPDLALAIDPADEKLLSTIGHAVSQIWGRHSPTSRFVRIIEVDENVRHHGERL